MIATRTTNNNHHHHHKMMMSGNKRPPKSISSSSSGGSSSAKKAKTNQHHCGGGGGGSVITKQPATSTPLQCITSRDRQKHHANNKGPTILPMDVVTGKPMPDWVTEPELLVREDFLKHVYHQINLLNHHHTTDGNKAAAFDDYDTIQVSIWESSYPGHPAGMHIAMFRKKHRGGSHKKKAQASAEEDWSCRLHIDFSILTGLTKTGWKTYQKQGCPSLWTTENTGTTAKTATTTTTTTTRD